MQRVITRVAKEGAFYAGVAFFVILSTFPFYWMVITSFKTNSDLYNVTNIPFWFNDPPTLEHFRYLFHETLFTTWLLNSLIIGVCVVVITLVTALPAAYRGGQLGDLAGDPGYVRPVVRPVQPAEPVDGAAGHLEPAPAELVGQPRLVAGQIAERA